MLRQQELTATVAFSLRYFLLPVALSETSGANPNERIAAMIASSESGVWVTVKTSLHQVEIKLFNSAHSTQFLWIRFSTGQSICIMRISVRNPPATTCGALRLPQSVVPEQRSNNPPHGRDRGLP